MGQDSGKKNVMLLRSEVLCGAIQAELNLEYDMYEAQFSDFLHAVRTGDRSGIRSLYQDAVRTYEASRWITDASIKDFKA